MTLSVTINGHNYNTDDYNAGSNPYGLGAGGWRRLVTTFVYDILADVGIGGQMTATDSVAIAVGSAVFTPAVMRSVPVGAPILAIFDANNSMYGTVSAVSATQITIAATSVTGSGTRAAWTLRPCGPQGPAGSVPLATNAQTKAGSSTTVAVTPASLFSVIGALIGKRTDISSGTTAGAAFTRYRLTGTATLTLPTLAADEWVIVEFALTGGAVGTVGRNSQAIDGAAADDTSTRYGDVVLYYCESAGVITTKQIGMIP